MFAYLQGTLASVQETHVVIDVHGVGYAAFIPSRMANQLPACGNPIKLYTCYVVRESSHTLYGFLSSEERNLFELLMNLSGIGPKLALNLIGHLTFQELQQAIARREIALLCRVPGVGKKTAERMVVELKDKLGEICPPCSESTVSKDLLHAQMRDATLALVNLGYHQAAAQKALQQSLNEITDTSDLPLLITTALRYL